MQRAWNLARWDDAHGSSAGCRLVRALPGAVLTQQGESWRLMVVDAQLLVGADTPPDPQRLWGEQYETQALHQLVTEHAGLQAGYDSRSELLEALLQVCATQERPVLGFALAGDNEHRDG